MENDWRRSARCLGAPPELFFPERSTPGNGGLEAKRICADCTVRLPCLDYAVAAREDGIWGGTSEETRAVLVKILEHGSALEYRLAVDEETSALGRLVRGFPDDRPATLDSTCARCGGRVPGRPAGRGTPRDRNGPAARCGLVSTFNRGCRCDPCSDAKRAHQSPPRGDSGPATLAIP